MGDSASQAGMQVVVFKVADQAYAVDIYRVSEIIRPRDVTPVPRSPAHIRGLANLRGKAVPILDLGLALGLSPVFDTYETRVVVVVDGDERIGLLVDSVSEVMRLYEDSIEPTPAALESAHHVLGIARADGQLITLLDLDKALGFGAVAN